MRSIYYWFYGLRNRLFIKHCRHCVCIFFLTGVISQNCFAQALPLKTEVAANVVNSEIVSGFAYLSSLNAKYKIKELASKKQYILYFDEGFLLVHIPGQDKSKRAKKLIQVKTNTAIITLNQGCLAIIYKDTKLRILGLSAAGSYSIKNPETSSYERKMIEDMLYSDVEFVNQDVVDPTTNITSTVLKLQITTKSLASQSEYLRILQDWGFDKTQADFFDRCINIDKYIPLVPVAPAVIKN